MATAETETSGLYVYGITLVGVECDADTIDHGRVRAVVREEPLGPYAPEVLEETLRDRTWLEEQLRAHEAVLEAVMAAGPVVPFRFGTIFRTEDELRSTLAGAEERLAGRLEELRGTSEWGVKTWVNRHVLQEWIEAHDEQAHALRAELDEAGTSGRRYLAQKRLERHVAAESERIALDRAYAAHEALAAEARDAQVERPSGFDERGAQHPVQRAAYLVEDVRREAFDEALGRAQCEDAALGIDYALSGPWPPYNFVEPLSA